MPQQIKVTASNLNQIFRLLVPLVQPGRKVQVTVVGPDRRPTGFILEVDGLQPDHADPMSTYWLTGTVVAGDEREISFTIGDEVVFHADGMFEIHRGATTITINPVEET